MFATCAFDDLEILGVIMAAACHDFEHPGVNNQYLIETRDSIALKYNGKKRMEK